MKDELKYWIWYSTVLGLGTRRKKKLLDIMKSPKDIWEADAVALAHTRVLDKDNISAVLDSRTRKSVDFYVERVSDLGLDVVTIEDRRYPESLKYIYDPPILLYARGEMYNEKEVIAVVGSRKASSYGMKTARNLARKLAENGITVISGMARGIDTYAHLGALDVKSRTIAVLGCGLDIVYPPENRKLIERITSEGGAVITEYPPGVQPLPAHFPVRNRIISGMSVGVVVVEARQRSGSLITARMALEQGRDVFAVPGNVYQWNSTGTNQLIKDGAKMVTDVEDILEEITWHKNCGSDLSFFSYDDVKKEMFLCPEEQAIIELLKFERQHKDQLIEKTDIDFKILNSVLLSLELKGCIKQEIGGYYSLCWYKK